MKQWITAALVTVAATTTTTALADDAVERSFYLGGGLGQYEIDIHDFDDLTTTIEKYKSDDTAWRAFAGLRMNRYFGMELDYVNLGRPRDEISPGVIARTETDGFAPYLVGTVPLGPFELFARAGYLFYETDSRVTSPLGTFTSNESGDDFTWSAGVGMTLAETINLRLEYEQFDFANTSSSNALWLTAAYRF